MRLLLISKLPFWNWILTVGDPAVLALVAGAGALVPGLEPGAAAAQARAAEQLKRRERK